MVRLGKQCWPGRMVSMPVLWAQTLVYLSSASSNSYQGHRLQEAFASASILGIIFRCDGSEIPTRCFVPAGCRALEGAALG